MSKFYEEIADSKFNHIASSDGSINETKVNAISHGTGSTGIGNTEIANKGLRGAYIAAIVSAGIFFVSLVLCITRYAIRTINRDKKSEAQVLIYDLEADMQIFKMALPPAFRAYKKCWKAVEKSNEVNELLKCQSAEKNTRLAALLPELRTCKQELIDLPISELKQLKSNCEIIQRKIKKADALLKQVKTAFQDKIDNIERRNLSPDEKWQKTREWRAQMLELSAPSETLEAVSSIIEGYVNNENFSKAPGEGAVAVQTLCEYFEKMDSNEISNKLCRAVTMAEIALDRTVSTRSEQPLNYVPVFKL